MRQTMLLIAMSSMASAAAATTPSVVTLTCVGTQTLSRADMDRPLSLPWSQTFTVDLTKMRYCGASCAPMIPADLSDPSKIVLRKMNADHRSQPTVYDTDTGAVTSHDVQDLGPQSQVVIDRTGTCTRA